jgi:hypothetical protein
MPQESFEAPTLLGRRDGWWYVQLQRNAGAYSALPVYRALHRVEESSGRWEHLLTVVDSSPRAMSDD